MSTVSQNPHPEPQPGAPLSSETEHASAIGPITPVRCPGVTCPWAVHGIPDKYTDARVLALAVHRAEEHGGRLTSEQIATAKERGWPLPQPTTTSAREILPLLLAADPYIPEIHDGPAPLSPEREQEIQSVQLGDWLPGEWKSRHVDGSGDYGDPDRYDLFHVGSGQVLATLPDWAGNVAMWIADAHEAVPELLAELDRLRTRLGAVEALVVESETADTAGIFTTDLRAALDGEPAPHAAPCRWPASPDCTCNTPAGGVS